VKFGICYQHFAAIKRHREGEQERERERERERETEAETERERGRARARARGRLAEGREKEPSLDNNRFYGCSCGEP
jgi:uncharacterized membrane protein YqiK